MSEKAALQEAGVSGAQAIRRATEVMRTVARLQHRGAKLNSIAHANNLSTSTAFRILRSLTEENVLRFDPTEKNYYLGPLLFELGLAAGGSAGIATRWSPVLTNIAKLTRLTSILYIRSGDELTCLACQEGSSPIRAVPVSPGQRLPLGVGAAGIAVLSTLEDEEIDQLARSHERAWSAYPWGDDCRRRILQSVQEVRNDGFAICDGGVVDGILDIAIPVLDDHDHVWLSLSVSSAADQMGASHFKNIAGIIREEAERLGSRA